MDSDESKKSGRPSPHTRRIGSRAIVFFPGFPTYTSTLHYVIIDHDDKFFKTVIRHNRVKIVKIKPCTIELTIIVVFTVSSKDLNARIHYTY